MTYGFGFWRSGYTTLIPWHWCWTCAPDQFDYLRGGYSGCGQRMDDDGEVIPAVYWSCFREGFDDARYVYTLQQAVVQRQDSTDPACQAAVREGRRLLQETWDAIRVQPKYLATGMWPSEEFDAIRWRLAAQTQELLQYPATNQGDGPVGLDRRHRHAPGQGASSSRRSSRRPRRENSTPSTWAAASAPGSTAPPRARSRSPTDARHEGKTGLRWTVVVDWEHDGGEGGKYPDRLAADQPQFQARRTGPEPLRVARVLDTDRLQPRPGGPEPHAHRPGDSVAHAEEAALREDAWTWAAGSTPGRRCGSPCRR